MHLTIATAAVAAAAAAAAVFIAAGPATAAPSTSTAGAGTATATQFQTVTDGQTVAVVEQEMGSAQTHSALAHSLPGSDDFAETWHSSSLLGLETFTVDFAAQGSQNPTVDDKAASIG